MFVRLLVRMGRAQGAWETGRHRTQMSTGGVVWDWGAKIGGAPLCHSLSVRPQLLRCRIVPHHHG